MLKKYFITGLLIWLPLTITFWVIRFIVTAMDDTLPSWMTPSWVELYHVPGFGLVMAAVIVLLTGVLTANIVGAWLLKLWEAVLKRIPIVSTIYSSVKQVSDTVLSPNGQAFRKAVLVQYPRNGCWTIAFVTGSPGPGVAEHLPGEHVSVYVPTTPNPTSGFFLILPKSEVIEVEMSVDTALKYIVSMGVVAPGAPFRVAEPARLPQSEI
ncbi:MAG TPA: DUF502 domain-containing protein [Burkholderiales bacterium]|nr:DUF502 domain-containing protein [Burkholderiales bacterium]